MTNKKKLNSMPLTASILFFLILGSCVASAGTETRLTQGEQLTTGTGGTPTSWYWDFGDGINPKQSMNAAHTFTNPEMYNFTLTVAN